MERSFYYPVSWINVTDLTQLLQPLQNPHVFEQRDLQLIIVYPDLPVHQYDAVRILMGGHGRAYHN